MTVWYGGTVADLAVAKAGGVQFNGAYIAGGQVIPNATVTAYLDAALTVAASDLVNETGAATGSTITARPSGYIRFGRPDGSTGPVYLSDGGGSSVAIYPAGGTGGGGSSPVRIAEFAAWGNSLTAQGNANGPKWVDGVGTDLGYAAYNGGISGQGSTEIIIRQGAFDPAVSVAGNVIPTSGPVVVTMLSTGVWRPQATSWTGILAGVTGVLAHDAGSGADPTDPDSPVGVFTWSFTPSTTGTSTTACPPGSTFHCTTGDAHKGAVTSIWTLTNNPATDPTIAIGLRDVDLAVTYSTNKWVVCTEHLRTNESQTAAKKQINTILRARFPLPGQIVDLEAIMGGWAIVLAGQNATSDDLTALAAGQAPPSIMSDTGSVKTHFNAYGYPVVRQAVTQALALQGAVPGLYPALKPTATGAAASASSPTTSGFTGTIPTAVTGATAYHWEYRRPGTSTWIYGPNSTGLTAAFTGLDAGTSYEFRYTPTNIAGYGPPSVVATGTSSGTPPTVLASDAGTGTAVTNISGRSTDQAVASRTGGSARAYTVNNNFTGKTSDGTGLGGQFYLSAGASSQAVVDVGATLHAVEVLVDVLPTSGTTAVILAYVDSSNYLLCTMASTGNMQLRKVVAGSSTVLATSPVGALTAGARVQGYKSASGLFVKVNGSQLLTSADSDVAALTGTKAGIQVSPGVRLRDVVWSDK